MSEPKRSLKDAVPPGEKSIAGFADFLDANKAYIDQQHGVYFPQLDNKACVAALAGVYFECKPYPVTKQDAVDYLSLGAALTDQFPESGGQPAIFAGDGIEALAKAAGLHPDYLPGELGAIDGVPTDPFDVWVWDKDPGEAIREALL